MKTLVISVGAAIALSGCALGIQSNGNSPSITYSVPRNYQAVYLRAQNQAAECLTAKKQYDVYAQVDPALQTALVAVRSDFGNIEVARTEIKAIDDKSTQVKHVVSGRGPWDTSALEAMRQSIRMDTSVCVVYK